MRLVSASLKKYRCCGLLLLLLFSRSFAATPDFAREDRMAAEIVDVILDGEALWLSADGREFLSIFTEAEQASTAVLILHGRGFHPDWIDTVHPLRVGLVEQGYSTLSIQMPVLEKDAKYYDYVPIFPYAYGRIEAAIALLRARAYEKVIVIAHSCSVHMAMAWIGERGDGAIDGFIGLGMGATDYQQPMRQPFALQDMTVPVFDLYGADEYPAVILQAPQRLEMIEKAANPKSRQAVLGDADHYFSKRGDALLAAVSEWLRQLD